MTFRFDRFHEWDEDFLREEMEAVPPSVMTAREPMTRAAKIVAIVRLKWRASTRDVFDALADGCSLVDVAAAIRSLRRQGRLVELGKNARGKLVWGVADGR